jgi:hypothetical protein
MSAVQILIDRTAWLMLHCHLLDERIASRKQAWGERLEMLPGLF